MNSPDDSGLQQTRIKDLRNRRKQKIQKRKLEGDFQKLFRTQQKLVALVSCGYVPYYFPQPYYTPQVIPPIYLQPQQIPVPNASIMMQTEISPRNSYIPSVSIHRNNRPFAVQINGSPGSPRMENVNQTKITKVNHTPASQENNVTYRNRQIDLNAALPFSFQTAVFSQIEKNRAIPMDCASDRVRLPELNVDKNGKQKTALPITKLPPIKSLPFPALQAQPHKHPTEFVPEHFSAPATFDRQIARREKFERYKRKREVRYPRSPDLKLSMIASKRLRDPSGHFLAGSTPEACRLCTPGNPHQRSSSNPGEASRPAHNNI